MLDVLVQRGFLTRLPDTTYALTLRLFELAHRHPPVDRLLDVAVPHMQALARRTGQSNHLSVHHDARLVVLARAEPPEPMSCLVRQGAHFAFHDDRVSARVITAFQSGERHDQYLDELLGERRSAARRRSLEQRLEQIRSRGYDEGPSDTVGGVVDVCFPRVRSVRRDRCPQRRLSAPARCEGRRAGGARGAGGDRRGDLPIPGLVSRRAGAAIHLSSRRAAVRWLEGKAALCAACHGPHGQSTCITNLS